MANEIRGKLFETITAVAIDDAIKLAGVKGEAFWNIKSQGMSIEPDFTIGTDPNAPTHLLLITASGSSKETDKKFWRNVGELQEVKSLWAKPPIVINVYYLSIVKAGLAEISRGIYDATIHVDEKPYFKPLADWVNSNLKSALKNRDERQRLLDSDKRSDSKLAAAIDSLAHDLATLLIKKNDVLSSLWQLMHIDYTADLAKPAPKRTNDGEGKPYTYVRRGLAKLMVMEPKVRQLLYAHYKGVSAIRDILPDYVVQLGFFKKTMAGYRLDDEEIRNVLNLLGDSICEKLIKQAPRAMAIWINPLRNLHRLETQVDFIEKHYAQVTDPVGLQKLLKQCYADPAGLSGELSDEKVWVYEIMISLLKAQSGRLQGYGLAQLTSDTGISDVAVRFQMHKFSQREEMLDATMLADLATGLSRRFKEDIPKADLARLKDRVADTVIKENLEDRLIPYRNFEPLLWLLEMELKAQGKVYAAKVPYEGWITEFTGMGRAAATTPFVKVGETLIHWKSAHGSHCNDKTKELAARARSVRYQYNPKTKRFSQRIGIRQLALIVDGDFNETHLTTLQRAGWDRIVYPDEIADLVKEL